MTIYVGRLTYCPPPKGTPSTFMGISESKEDLEQWAISKWNELMPQYKLYSVRELRKIEGLSRYNSWDIWEQVDGRVQMHYLLPPGRDPTKYG